jgi:hypothetical protein
MKNLEQKGWNTSVMINFENVWITEKMISQKVEANRDVWENLIQ